jgi:hypothetical protein
VGIEGAKAAHSTDRRQALFVGTKPQFLPPPSMAPQRDHGYFYATACAPRAVSANDVAETICESHRFRLWWNLPGVPHSQWISRPTASVRQSDNQISGADLDQRCGR